MEGSIVLEFILELLKGAKCRKKGEPWSDVLNLSFHGEEFTLAGCKYLLGQVIRQYNADKHAYVSEEADKLWKQIRNDDMKKYCYTNKITCEKAAYNADGTIREEILYKGNEKVEGKENPNKILLEVGSEFAFNSIFHDEHMTDIKTITDRLLALENPDCAQIKEILDSIMVARILKSEDRRIGKKANRGDMKNIMKLYQDAGIKLIALKN